MASLSVTSFSEQAIEGESFLGSITYLKRLIPITLINIIYNRFTFPDIFFDYHCIEDVDFKKLSAYSRHVDNPLYKVYGAAKDAMKTLEDRSISDVLFLFKKKDTDELIEFYKFSFKYNDNAETMIEKELLYEGTAEFLEMINQLECLPKLEEEEILFGITLFLNDGCNDFYTPKDFELSKSKSADKVDDCDNFYKMVKCSLNCIEMKLLTKGSVFETFTPDDDIVSSESEEEEGSTAKSDKQTKKKTRMSFWLKHKTCTEET